MDLLLARVSEAAYKGVRPLKRLGFNKVVKFRSGRTGTKAYLAINDNDRLAVLTFRGTERDGRDILTDISISKEEYKGAKIHSGFLRAYKSVEKHINKEVSRIPEEYEFHVTGHSLGGALAVLYCAYGVIEPLSLVTYGQPRVGDKSLLERLSQINYTRVVYQSDVVTRVPYIGYTHKGRVLYFNTNREWVENPTWFSMFFDRLFSSLSDRITDHRIRNYVNSLQ